MIRAAIRRYGAQHEDSMKQKLVITALATGLAVGFVACDKPSPTPPSLPGPSSGATNRPATLAVPHPEFQRLIGKWQRPDGGYVLEIRSADGAGKLDASYANPSPIKVSRALAYREGGATKVFIELTDVNYPGCIYQLALDEPHDQLFGTYFQAALQQTFDVAFARLK